MSAMSRYDESTAEIVRRETEGVDLVAAALENPAEFMENRARRVILLGREVSIFAQRIMVKKITDGTCPSIEMLIGRAANPTKLRMPMTLDSWKLVVCDARRMEDSADLEREYQAQLLAEEQQAPLERAREAVRYDDERAARSNAKLMLAALAKHHYYAVWRAISHSPPSWVSEILDRELAWGYVFYKTTQVNEHISDDDWNDAPERLEDLDTVFYNSRRREKAIWETAGPGSVHSQGRNFLKYWSDIWVAETFSDDDLKGPREHFRQRRTALNRDDGILEHTYIVLTSDSVYPDLMAVFELNDLLKDGEKHLFYWLWACDAN